MTLRKIDDIPLYADGSTPFFCHDCRSWDAEWWVCSPDGFVTGAACRRHGEEILREYSTMLNETWSLEPIYDSSLAPFTCKERRNIATDGK